MSVPGKPEEVLGIKGAVGHTLQKASQEAALTVRLALCRCRQMDKHRQDQQHCDMETRRSNHRTAANRAIVWETLHAETTTIFRHELALTFVWLVVIVGR